MSTEKAINEARKRVVDAVKKTCQGVGYPTPYSHHMPELNQALEDLEALETPFEYVVLGHFASQLSDHSGGTVEFRGHDNRGNAADVRVRSMALHRANVRLPPSYYKIYKISITEDPRDPE